MRAWYSNIWLPRTMGIIFLQFNGEEKEFIATKVNAKTVNNAGRFETLDEAIKFVGKSKAIHLHVKGTGVLSRLIENAPNYKEGLIISGNPNEFIFCSYSDSIQIAISFFRRALIQQELDYCTENNIHLIGVSAGDVPGFNLLEDESILLDYKLSIKENRISGFERSLEQKSTVKFRGETIEKEDFISKCLFHHHRTTEKKSLLSEDLQKNAENYRHFSQFRAYGIISVSCILMILMGNYFYQNHLNNEIAQLQADLSLSDNNLALLDRLDQEKIRKEQLVKSAGVTSTRFLSYYLDEIGRTVPKGIQLQTMQLFPLEGKLKNKHKVEVNNEQIIINGSTPENVVLDDWIEHMDRFEWIKSIELLNYLKAGEELAEFKLLITLAH